jgi:hypothetical protein
MPVIGYLSARSPDDTTHLVAAFRRGKAVSSNQNVTIEFRWALGQYDRLPALATELVRRPVAILATTGGEPAARRPRLRLRPFESSFSLGRSGQAAARREL